MTSGAQIQGWHKNNDTGDMELVTVFQVDGLDLSACTPTPQ